MEDFNREIGRLGRFARAILPAILAMALCHGIAFAAEAPTASGSNNLLFESALARGTWATFAVAFISGLGLTLTPCVYPMIAITVAVFGGAKQARSRWRAAALSAVFVLGMASLFTALGVAFALSGRVFGSFLANPIVMVALALVFGALSAAMFGAFEFALPSSLNNRLATLGGIGFGGAFVLGLVSALVAAPCTGPFMTGLLLWIGTTKNALLGASVMFTFALGLGAPFFLVGTFAVSLPKGGAWMLGVKWFFGVILAVLSLYFLRIAVPSISALASRSPGYVGAAAIILAAGIASAIVYMAAEKKRSPIAHLSTPAKLISIPLAVIGSFMILLSLLTPKAVLEWTSNEPEARALAKAEHRPVIIDFGAEWCAACKELTLHTFADPRVREEAARFVAVQVDATNEDDPQVQVLKEKYRVVGLPTVVVIGGDGVERARFNEFVPAEAFLKAISAVD